MKITDRLNELRGLDQDDLGGRLKQARRELYELRFKLAVGQLEDHRQIRNVRKDIARVLTVIHERELGMVIAVREPEPEAAAAAAAPVAAGETAPAAEEEEEEKAKPKRAPRRRTKKEEAE